MKRKIIVPYINIAYYIFLHKMNIWINVVKRKVDIIYDEKFITLHSARPFRYSDCKVRCILTEPICSTTKLFYQPLPSKAYFLNKNWRKNNLSNIWSFFSLSESSHYMNNMNNIQMNETLYSVSINWRGKDLTKYLICIEDLLCKLNIIILCAYFLNCSNDYEIMHRFWVKE